MASPHMRVRPLRLAAACGAALLGACDNPTAPEGPLVPAAMQIVGGDSARGTVGTELPHPLVVRVVDAAGRPVNGQIVNFRVTSGGGSVFAGAALTNADGMALERWTLGTSTSTPQRMEARAIDPTTGAALVFAEFAAIPLAGAPHSLTAISEVTLVGPVGAAPPDSLKVRVADQYDNPVIGLSVDWALVPEGGVLAHGASSTDSAGIAANSWSFGTTSGTWAATARVTALETPVAFTATVMPGAAASLAITAPADSTATVGTSLTASVTVLDQHGNPVPRTAVRFSTTPGATLTQELVGTDTSGIASVTWMLSTSPVVNSLFTSVGELADTLRVRGLTGPAARVEKASGDAQVAPPGATVPVAPGVRVLDTYGNPVEGVPVAFAVAGGGGIATGVQATTNAEGVARVGSWTLGPDRGANALRATVNGGSELTFAATAAFHSPDITVSVTRPTRLQIVGDTVNAIVFVSSKQALASVRLTVNGYVTTLPAQGGSLAGTLVIAGAPHGPLVLVATATDVNGAVTDALVDIIHDTPPVVAVTAPTLEDVARPSLAVSARCVDDAPGGCSSFILRSSWSGKILMQGTASLEGTVSLAEFNGTTLPLEFEATDSRGQVTKTTGRVHVEASPLLVPVSEVPGWALDWRTGRTLYSPTVVGGLAIRSASGPDEVVAIPEWRSGWPTSSSLFLESIAQWLTPAGAIGVGCCGFPRFYDWKNGAYTQSEHLSAPDAIDVNGRYAAFAGQLWPLHRRDLQLGTDIVVESSGGNSQVSVAENGDVAFRTPAFRIGWYHGGMLLRLASDTAAHRPRTDGVHVVYHTRYNNKRHTIILHDGSSETILAADVEREPWPDRDYAVAGGWTAFTRPDAVGVRQVWRRSPAGTIDQVTQSQTGTSIDAIAPDGTVVTSDGVRRYRAAPGAALQDVSSALGRVVWRDGRFVVLLGDTAFELR